MPTRVHGYLSAIVLLGQAACGEAGKRGAGDAGVAHAPSLEAGAPEDGGAALRVVCNLAPRQGGASCAFDPAAGECLEAGVLNVQTTGGYAVGLAIEDARKREDGDAGSSQRAVEIKELEVEVQSATGKPISFRDLPNPFTVPVSTSLPAGSRTSLVTTPLPAVFVSRLRTKLEADSERFQTVRIHLLARGEDGSGQRVESAPFVYPITLKNISLVQADGVCKVPKGDTCVVLIGQDAFVDLCSCLVDDSCR